MEGAPGWVAPMVAFSLFAMALAFVALAAVLIIFAARIARQAAQLADDLHALRAALTPALSAVTDLTEDGKAVTGAIRREAEALARTSGQLRAGVEGGAERLRSRLDELDTLYEVLYEEVEETVITLAATLHTVRSSTGLLGKVGRRLVGRRRRKGNRRRE